MATRNIEKLYFQTFSAVDDGMHLELCISDEFGNLAMNEKPYPIALIRADDGERQWFVIATEDGDIAIPVAEIERAISRAKQDVHSEKYFGHQ